MYSFLIGRFNTHLVWVSWQEFENTVEINGPLMLFNGSVLVMHAVVFRSDITLWIKIDKPLVVYEFW